MNFPKGFLWGAAIAAYQVEGGIENVDWAQASRDGKVPVCGLATDHYHKFEGDFDIAHSLGHNAHRFSIEWARIEPQEGKFDTEAIEHYRKVLRALHSRGLEPFVTLWHFTLPLWFSDKGGFEQIHAAEIFARYCAYVVRELGGEAKYWMTMNEPLVWSSDSHLKGKWPPFHKSFFSFLRVNAILARVHQRAYTEIKKVNSIVQVGIAKHNIYFASDWKPWNLLAKHMLSWYWNRHFLNTTRQSHDFIGLNHYFYHPFGRKQRLPKSDMGWDIYPEALYQCLVELKRYGKPIFVTENGLADAGDEKRADFIRDYVAEVGRAMSEGVLIKGYFYWSLLDNYEWSYGFTKRFGLVEVDYETLQRKIRPSALVYKSIIERNSI